MAKMRLYYPRIKYFNDLINEANLKNPIVIVNYKEKFNTNLNEKFTTCLEF